MNIFKKRIEALEARLLPSYITLTMPDGSIERIPGGIDLLHLFCDVQSGQEYPVFKKIIDSVGSDEKGHMLELFKVLAAGPIPRGMTCDEWEKDNAAISCAMKGTRRRNSLE
jgi:hypothetical protein